MIDESGNGAGFGVVWMTALEEIKKALEGVTPGPWEVYSEKVADKAAAIAESAYQVEHTDTFVGEIFMLNAGGKCPALTGCGPCSEANASYIAAVNPAAISELLSTLESLQRENEKLRASRDGYVKQRDELQRLYDEERANCKREAELATHMANDCNDAQERAQAAEAEVKRLREELKFYGDAWCFTTNPKRAGLEWKPKEALLDDCGNRARTALASIGGEHHGN